MPHYVYNGKNLKISRFADIPYDMRPGGTYSREVQRILDSTELWKEGDNPIETMWFQLPIFPAAVPIHGAEVVWGIHKGHRAREPKLSPFINKPVDRRLMGFITVELERSGDRPLLTRVYGGDYTPPLPWMVSAKDADGGRGACRRYWRSHAYLDRGARLIRVGTRTKIQPSWLTAK